jgi:hypothetical protein
MTPAQIVHATHDAVQFGLLNASVFSDRVTSSTAFTFAAAGEGEDFHEAGH